MRVSLVTNEYAPYLPGAYLGNGRDVSTPKPRKRPLPRVSVAGRIERGYYEGLVGVIDADDHCNRIGGWVREAVNATGFEWAHIL